MMTPTILNNQFLKPLLKAGAAALLFSMGWKTKGKVPDIEKYILIAAPHTSNWDFFFFLLIVFKFRLPVYWMGKRAMFRWPFHLILKRLGGIPVDRSKSNQVVPAMIHAFNTSEKLILTIAPSGTRKPGAEWKTGFYHIASQAGVPIVCGFLDYRDKTGGIGPVFYPTKDMEADMSHIQSFYSGIYGRYSSNPDHPFLH